MSGQASLTCWRAVTAESPYVRLDRAHLLEGGDGGVSVCQVRPASPAGGR